MRFQVSAALAFIIISLSLCITHTTSTVGSSVSVEYTPVLHRKQLPISWAGGLAVGILMQTSH